MKQFFELTSASEAAIKKGKKKWIKCSHQFYKTISFKRKTVAFKQLLLEIFALPFETIVSSHCLHLFASAPSPCCTNFP